MKMFTLTDFFFFCLFRLVFRVNLGNQGKRTLLTGTRVYYCYDQRQSYLQRVHQHLDEQLISSRDWHTLSTFKLDRIISSAYYPSKLNKQVWKLGSIKCQSKQFLWTLIGVRAHLLDVTVFFYHSVKSIHDSGCFEGVQIKGRVETIMKRIKQ